MTGAPTWVDDTQLDELGITLTPRSLERKLEEEEPDSG
jgi:hypothetical protein